MRPVAQGVKLAGLYEALTSLILLTVLVGGVRIFKGPTRADRMIAAQFFATASVAIFLILAEARALPSLRNLALVFVALAALTTVAFVKAYGAGEGRRPHE